MSTVTQAANYRNDPIIGTRRINYRHYCKRIINERCGKKVNLCLTLHLLRLLLERFVLIDIVKNGCYVWSFWLVCALELLICCYVARPKSREAEWKTAV